MYPVELESVFKSYNLTSEGKGNLEILKGINLTLEQGVSTAVIGKSGSGKSTLLHITGLLDNPSSGIVLIDGNNVKSLSDSKLSALRNKFFGFIFQSNLLLEDFNALENVMMSSLIAGLDRKSARQKAVKLLEEIGLGERLGHYPSQLSGGEKQRTAICRALINEPQFILADEPTGSLDEQSASEVENLLFNMCKNHNTGILLVTHNKDFAYRCDRVFNLSNGVLEQLK